MGVNLNVQAVNRMYAAKMAKTVQKEEEEKASQVEIQDRLEISEEGRKSLLEKEDEKEELLGEEAVSEEPKAEEVKTPEDEEAVDSEKRSGKVGFNAGKRARQLAAASTPEQVQMVLDLLNKDLDDCEAGLDAGMCDENEVRKVKAMIQRAHQRMSEVSGQKNEEENPGTDAFAMASLM